MINTNFFFLISEAQQRTFEAKIGWILWFILFAILVFVSALFAFIFTGEKGRKKRRNEFLDSNVRIYSYNFARQTFYSFDKVDLKNTKTYTCEQFYSQFTPQDKYLVEDWLRNIAHNQSHPDYLQADVIISKNKKRINSMLEFVSINNEKNIIHFTSHLMPNAYMVSSRSIKFQKNALPQKYILKNFEDAQKFINKGSLDSVGAVFCFKVYRVKPMENPSEDTQLRALGKEIQKVLGKFLGKGRKIFLPSDSESVVVDNLCLSKIIAMDLATTMQTNIQGKINVSAPQGTFRIAVGVSNNTYYKRNFSLAKEQSEKMSDAIIKGLSNEKILFYDESFFLNYQQGKLQKDEIRMVVKNATFRNYYIPTLNITTGQPDFFLLNCYPYGTQVKDIASVINIASELGIVGKFFDAFIGKCAVLAKNRQEPITFATKIPYSAVGEFINAIKRSNNDNLKWIIVIRESDILTRMEDANIISRVFHDYTRKGFRFGILVENSTSTLRMRILKTASYFFIPPEFTSASKDTERSKNDLRNIQNSYMIYRSPLVYYGLKNIEGIELCAHYGGTIFSCNEIANESSRIQSIPQETIDSVLNETGHIAPENQL